MQVLEALDAELLRRAKIVFAGGTRLALAYGEYRVSRDLDLLAADRPDYASVRSLIRDGGAERLFRSTNGLELPRPPRIDQYGVRFPVVTGAQSIKVERTTRISRAI